MFKHLSVLDSQPKTFKVNGYKVLVWRDASSYFSGGKPNFMFQVYNGNRQVATIGQFQTALQALNASMLYVI